MTAAEKLKMTYPEYLAAEEQSDEKHDFLDGEVFARSGGTLELATLYADAEALDLNAPPPQE